MFVTYKYRYTKYALEDYKVDFLSIFVLAVALAMDAFGVSVTDGIVLKEVKLKNAIKIGFFFGAFQFIMPCIGSFFAEFAMDYIQAIDHWIAFVLLVFLGIKMIVDAKNEEKEVSENPLSFSVLTMMAIATSIDALAAGITIAAVGSPILVPSIIIGIVAFIFSFAGIYIGNKFGDVLAGNAEVVGGVMLILIGIKTLVEHLS